MVRAAAGTRLRPASLMTAAEVAGLYHVDPATAARWGRSGRLLTIRTPGGRRKFFEVEVRALLRGETPEQARKLAEAERDRLTGGGS